MQLLTTKETELTEAIERLEAEGEVAQRYIYDGFAFDGYTPYICHFFTWAKFLENKIHIEKRQFFVLNL